MSFSSKLKDPMIDEFFRAILILEDEEQCYRFFEDIATVGELHSLAQRLAVAKMLEKNETYTVIAEQTGASTATISRVKRALNYGADGYRSIIKKM